MSFKDIIKSSVYDNFAGGTGLHFFEVILIMLTACLIGAYIFFVYKSFYKAAFYSKDFNIAIAGMSIIVAAIMIAMQSNLLVSLGMVGALSIVRFRTAVKNPLDLLYLFWSISAGIICGVSLYFLAAMLCIIMTFAIWILGKVRNAKTPALLIVRADADIDMGKVEKIIKAHTSYFHLCSVNSRNKENESIYELKAREIQKLVRELGSIKKVRMVNCLEHDGEIRA